jgi:alpha-1,2-mannosyltransferase
MKAAVIHHTLNSPGGETTVAIETIELLHDLGYEVELVTVQAPDLEGIAKAYGKRVHVDRTVSLLPFKMSYFGIYQRLLTLLSSRGIKDSDVIINTHGDALPYAGISGTPYIVYLHFPTFLMNSAGYVNGKYQRSLFWKAYFKPYQAMARHFANKAMSRSNLILTNSEFSREAIRKAFPQADPGVLYPPVDVERFSPAYRRESGFAEPQVLMVSRFSPEKQLENAIRIARLLQGDARMQIVGTLAPANRHYFSALQKMIDDYGLRERVRLTPNATNEELVSAMSKSVVYLHTMAGEHFGVSIIEAMAAGLVPVVPSYGGCSEIVSPRHQYRTLEEAADRINKSINSSTGEDRRQVHEVAMQFSTAQFRKGLKRHIERITGSRIRHPPSSSAATAA